VVSVLDTHAVDPRAEAIFQRFRVHPDARAIASPCAIDGVMRAIERYKPQRILEVGAGIGTLTAAILEAAGPDVFIVTAEDNEHCREVLCENLGEDMKRATLVESAAQVDEVFDLVVVDGEQIDDILRVVAPGGVLIVEGDRDFQRQQFVSTDRPYCEQHVRTLRLMAADDPWSHASVERYQGGYFLFRFEPTLSERRQFAIVHYWYNTTIKWRRRLWRLARLEHS
jgi:hypothetical protein